jgi:hypothetical protein
LERVSSQGACAVCGRTFLVGEQVHSFVSVEGRHEVCELCAASTAELGWLPADEEGAEEKLRAGGERRPGFLARIFSRPRREPEQDYFAEAGFGEEVGAEDEEQPAPDAASEPLAIHEIDTERYDVEAEWGDEPRGRPVDLPAPEEAPAPPESTASPVPPAPPESTAPPEPSADVEPPAPLPLPDPAGRGMRPRRLQPDLTPTGRFERAIARFNAGEAGRTVAGLTRTLGAPSVSVGDSAGTADEVRITVAWELTWYQWGVDLGDELRPVYELAKGFEIDEIDAAARQWNASAHDGRIVMVAPSRREAVDGKPVHR